jgi:murein DD-endopeptidase MepM/ murein hydrolase activator NlpD
MLKRFKGLFFLILLCFFIFFVSAQALRYFEKSDPDPREEAIAYEEEKEPEADIPVVTVVKPEYVYGIPTGSLEIVEGVVERGENLSQILSPFNISPATVHTLGQKAKNVHDIRRINFNRPYTILHLPDSAQTAQYFIYEPSELEYIIYDLREELAVTKEVREVEVVEQTLAGEISHNLYLDMIAAGGSAQLVNYFADIYAWRINLSRLQPGDKFKLIYEEKFVNDVSIGLGKIKAAYFEHNRKPLYAIGFDQGQGLGYYDQEGKSLKKAFLKEPLEYTRISSRFTNNRYHPVQKVNKPHLGTDFAAPHGTPIRSVGEGVVVEARRTGGNGNYVKIKHNQTYSTQYLHMSRFAKGIREGARVLQGQTIGYVGSTGLATGPHLCYRFWKNGKQVDALKEKLPVAEPVQKKYLAAFQALKEETVKRLQAVGAEEPKQEVIALEQLVEEDGV